MKNIVFCFILFASTLNAQTFNFDFQSVDLETHSYATGKFGSNAPKVDGPKVGTIYTKAEVSDILNGGDDNYHTVAISSTNLTLSSKTIFAKTELSTVAENKTAGVSIINDAAGLAKTSVNCFMTGQPSAVFSFSSSLVLDADENTADGFRVEFYVGPYNAVVATYNQANDEWDLSGAYTNDSGNIITVNESVSASTIVVKTYNCHAPANEDELIHLIVGVNNGLGGTGWLSKSLSTVHTGVKKTYETDCWASVKFVEFK